MMRAGYPVVQSDRSSVDPRTLSEPEADVSADLATSEIAIEEDESMDWFVDLLLAEIASQS